MSKSKSKSGATETVGTDSDRNTKKGENDKNGKYKTPKGVGKEESRKSSRSSASSQE